MPLVMQNTKFTNEKLLYLLIFALALGVRFLNLGAFPLADFEAEWALQALDLARGNPFIPGPHPAYVNLTGILFSVFGSSDAVARFVPALVGSLLIFAPFAWRDKLGRGGALIFSIALAFDAGLVALSRQIGSPMMAITFFFVAISLAYARKPALSGVCAGLALLSGPSIWMGLLGLAITFGVNRLLGISLNTDKTLGAEAPENSAQSPWTGIIFAIGTLLTVGSLFSFFPKGLGAFASSLTGFLTGWTQSSNVPFLKVLITLPIYSPIMLIFGLVAFVSLWRRDRKIVFVAGIWFLTLMGLTWTYLGKQTGEIAWITVPLWGLAAWAISAHIDDGVKNPISLGQGAAIFFLLALSWLTLSGLRFAVEPTQWMQWLLILGIFVLAGLSALFVGMGWSWNFARNGSVLGLVTALGVYSISVMFGTTQWRTNSPLELWFPVPGMPSDRLLDTTLYDLAISFEGEPYSLEIVSFVDSPGMKWTLRDYSNAHFVEAMVSGDLPPVVVTDWDGDHLPWTGSYRGQDFAWQIFPGWWGVLPANWGEWLVSREAPLQTDHVLLWARSDVFPDEPQTQVEGELDQ